MAKILLVEDEVNIASFIERGLKEFGHSVSVANDGDAGWELIRQEAFDLLILDIIMPKMNGLELCRLYRQQYGYLTPVIMLTALGTTEDIVKGLDSGADDYLVKPFSFQELEARIKAILRRGREDSAQQLVCDDLVLNCNTRRARRKEVEIELTVKEYRLLDSYGGRFGIYHVCLTLTSQAMKIGRKIALFYTLVTVLTTMAVIGVFYLFSSRYIDGLYRSYLREKAFLTAQKHWERDEVDEQSYQTIQRKYDELLPEAKEILLDMDSDAVVRDTLNKYLSAGQQKQLLESKEMSSVSFVYQDMLGAALYYPDNEGNFIVIIMSHNSYGVKIQEHLLLLSAFLVLCSSVLIFFIGQLYSTRILIPLQHVLLQLKQIRGNSLNRRLKTTGNKDELDHLIETLNSMLDRIDTAFRAEKSFVSHASHELNNPITAIQGECEISLLKERSTDEYIEALRRIAGESKRLSNLIRHLLFLSRQEEDIRKNNVEEIRLADLLEEAGAANSRIRLQYPEDAARYAVVSASPYLFKIALQNVIDNACKYSQGEVLIRLYKEEERWGIAVKDSGIGIPADEMELIFQSFYRGSNTREYAGQGIGLSLSMKIFSVYRGKVSIRSEEGKGTEVRVVFA